MKKRIIILCIILIIVIFIKYFNADYKLSYIIDNHNVTVEYKNKRYYIEIDKKYNFDIYKRRTLKRLKISEIKVIDDNELHCIIPKIKYVETYPLCYLNDEYIDYNLIDNEAINFYKKEKSSDLNGSFSFNNNLNKKEFILLWNYNGFYKMNNDKIEAINILEEGRYDNNNMYLVKNKILFPNYEEEYVFKTFYLMNIENGKSQIIKSKYEFSYDGYIVGHIKNKVYFYDNKNSSLYEINIKKLEVKLVGSEKLGYYKYVNNKKVKAKKSEYKNQKINYDDLTITNYKYFIENNNLYRKINDNKDLKVKIFEGDQIKIISEYKNNLYFISKDIMYKYNPSQGNVEIFNYFELNFNPNNIIYVYNK